MTVTESISTKERILEAAERLFAEQGFAGTSLRSITAEAGVNLAAIHYHFGSKEGLIGAVFHNCFAPLNEERIRSLEEVLRRTGDDQPGLEAIIEAFIGPALRRSGTRKGKAFLPRLIGRALLEADETLQGILRPHFDRVRDPFTMALRRALPDLSEEELRWRTLFLVGAMAHTMMSVHELHTLLGSGGAKPSGEKVLRKLTDFVAAGMRSGTPAATGGEGS